MLGYITTSYLKTDHNLKFIDRKLGGPGFDTSELFHKAKPSNSTSEQLESD